MTTESTQPEYLTSRQLAENNASHARQIGGEPVTELQPASINAECKLWRVNSGTYEPEPESKHWGTFWEPLNVRLGPDARPYCCLGDSIQFFDRSGNKVLSDMVQHYAFMGLHPHLLYLNGMWREVLGGRCEYRDGQWCMRWNVSTATKWAVRLNAIEAMDAASARVFGGER